MIIAKCDASYKDKDKGCYIGIGICIYKNKNNINPEFKKNLSFNLKIQHNAAYAELVGIIELLKKLQKIEGEEIYVYNDCQGIFKLIKGKNKNSRMRKEYYIECEFAKFLINKLKEKIM